MPYLFHRSTRRKLLSMAGGLIVPGLVANDASVRATPQDGAAPGPGVGTVAGQPQAVAAGEEVLRAGGNAVDAACAAALVAATVSIHNCGIGGYGGHMVIAYPDGRVTAIDFNSTAPAAARPDMFPLDEKGQVKGNVHFHGWLAAGVPGTLAGIELALQRHGTRSFAEMVRPAIRYAREGFPLPAGLAALIRSARNVPRDPGTARLLLPDGMPPKEGTVHRNPELAALLQTLADRGSVESFYRGDIAVQIAEGFRKNGGLVTEADLAAYRAREVEPLALEWNGCTIRTAPLTAGGATVLQALATLKALVWEKEPAGSLAALQMAVEARRLAWHDRLTLLGDPEHAKVPLDRLLSPAYAVESAERVRAAVRDGKPVPALGDGRRQDGTIHLSAADGRGMLAAITLTHGGGFGAQVTVEGLGLVLGHGMSRFDPRPGHPNCPGPGKRPLHNMCPTVVLRDGRPVLALGAAGGRKIVNSVADVLTAYVGRSLDREAALAAPRFHTEGPAEVLLDPKSPAEWEAHLKGLGYTVRRGAMANANAAGAQV